MAPASRQACCHGIRLEWCSITVMATSSPASSTVGAKALATMFRLSEVLRVKITSRGSPAPIRPAIWARTLAMASVALTESEYRPRSGLAFMVS